MRPAYGAKEDRDLRSIAVTIVVDVANVMGSRPDGWWRDRAGAAVRLYAEMADLAASGRVALPPGTEPARQEPPGAVPPGFVMVLEGAAKAAASRISSAAPSAVAGDSAAPIEVRPGEVKVVLARGSGDDTIVAAVRALSGHRVVVTADRELRRDAWRPARRSSDLAGCSACCGRELSAAAGREVIGPPGPFNRAAPLPLLARRTEAPERAS